MPRTDNLLPAIEAVHAAGLDEALWPAALQAVTNVIGAVGTTFEVVDKTSGRLSDFWSFGIPQENEIDYIDHFVTINPRMPLYRLIDIGDVGYDSLIINEAAMDRDPYYSEFLPRMGLRYFVSTFLTKSSGENAVVAAQLSPAHGHASRGEIALMRALTPHLQQAFDLTRRLRLAGRMSQGLGSALDWLADGAALVRADGTLVYANDSLQAIARKRDGIRISRDRRLEFAAADVGARFGRALAAVCGWRGVDPRVVVPADLIVPRAADVPPYVVSVRPLALAADQVATTVRTNADADAIVFVHDPLQRNASTVELLREIFGLTEAEAGLARALQAGTPLAEYARAHRLSLNTVYTHLRRIKAKTHTRRQAELIHKLNDLRLVLRPVARADS